MDNLKKRFRSNSQESKESKYNTSSKKRKSTKDNESTEESASYNSESTYSDDEELNKLCRKFVSPNSMSNETIKNDKNRFLLENFWNLLSDNETSSKESDNEEDKKEKKPVKKLGKEKKSHKKKLTVEEKEKRNWTNDPLLKERFRLSIDSDSAESEDECNGILKEKDMGKDEKRKEKMSSDTDNTNISSSDDEFQM